MTHRDFILGSALGTLVLGSILGCSDRASPAEAVEETVARVEVVPIRLGKIAEQVISYGMVVAVPGARRSPSVPFESVVERVYVAEGMPVTTGQTMLRLSLSPSSQARFADVRSAYVAASEQLQTMMARDSLGLTTRDQLSLTGRTFRDAETRFDQISSWQGLHEVKATADGVVTRVNAVEGAIVPAGSALVQFALRGRFEVRLGIEPEDVNRIKIGQTVQIKRVGKSDGQITSGSVRRVSRAVNPGTRLVDVMISVTDAGQLLYAETVRGVITIIGNENLIVPRTAVLTENGESNIFTVSHGRARKHPVRIGAETDRESEIWSPTLVKGDSVVVLGNYVLSDSMRIRITDATESISNNR